MTTLLPTPPATARLDYPKRDIFLHIDSRIEANTRARSCGKEPDLVEWMEQNYRPGEVFFDIGANIGAYSMVASKYLNADLKVYAFEPSFVTFSQLCRNIQLNQLSSSVTPLQVALADKTGLETLNYSNLDPGGALHMLGRSVDFKGEPFEPVFRQPVISFRLDDLLDILKLPQPNHIKLDVDGIELAILRGGVRTLAHPELRTVMVELEKGTDDEAGTLVLMKDAGFELARAHKCLQGVNAGPFAKMFNYFFTRR